MGDRKQPTPPPKNQMKPPPPPAPPRRVSNMRHKPVKAMLTIHISLTPGICRWCRCTYNNPCANGCSWADRAQTLCTECVPLDKAMETTTGRQALVLFLQENWQS